MKLTAFFIAICCIVYLSVSCNKTGGIPPPPPPDPCISINIGMSGTVTNPSVPGAKDGSISVTAWGGTNFRFSINDGPFQSGTVFNDLNAGDYEVTVRNSEGCMSSVSFTLVNPVISCAGVNIGVATTATANTLCEAPQASVTITAMGGTAPYTYSLDNGAFQATNIFYNLSTGSHSVTVKDANGCMGSASTTVNNAAAGPLFAQVRSLILSQCVYCHGSNNPSAGLNLSDPCVIVAKKDRIKARAVDGNPTPMPSTGLLPASERQKITNWINAGGGYGN